MPNKEIKSNIGFISLLVVITIVAFGLLYLIIIGNKPSGVIDSRTILTQVSEANRLSEAQQQIIDTGVNAYISSAAVEVGDGQIAFVVCTSEDKSVDWNIVISDEQFTLNTNLDTQPNSALNCASNVLSIDADNIDIVFVAKLSDAEYEYNGEEIAISGKNYVVATLVDGNLVLETSRR